MEMAGPNAYISLIVIKFFDVSKTYQTHQILFLLQLQGQLFLEEMITIEVSLKLAYFEV